MVSQCVECNKGEKVNVVLHFCKGFPFSDTKPLFVSQGCTQKQRQRGRGWGLGEGRQVCASEGEAFTKFGSSIKETALFENSGWGSFIQPSASVGECELRQASCSTWELSTSKTLASQAAD